MQDFFNVNPLSPCILPVSISFSIVPFDSPLLRTISLNSKTLNPKLHQQKELEALVLSQAAGLSTAWALWGLGAWDVKGVGGWGLGFKVQGLGLYGDCPKLLSIRGPISRFLL